MFQPPMAQMTNPKCLLDLNGVHIITIILPVVDVIVIVIGFQHQHDDANKGGGNCNSEDSGGVRDW